MISIDKNTLQTSGNPRMKLNREYVLKKSTAAELNTYLGFKPFAAMADVLYEGDRAELMKNPNSNVSISVAGVRSIFNKSGAVLLGGDSQDVLGGASPWRVSNNVPLIDSPSNRKSIRDNSGYTIKELVEASQAGVLGSAIYAYSDFMYCKYLGQIPNNYLITLRRFPTPVDDYISSAGISGGMRKEVKSTNPIPIGQLVTWMNTPGNEVDKLLTYSVSMPYDEKKASVQQDNTSADSQQKPLNSAFALFDKTYQQQYQSGYSGQAINHYVEKMFPKLGGKMDAPYSGLIGWQDQNKVYGPVDAVKKVYYRGDQGIDFNQSIKITFEYELRSYNGINGRQAMLDLLSNILNVTYTTGTFWGGGYIGTGAHQSNIFSNLNIMKAKGGFTNFMDAFTKDVHDLAPKAKAGVEKFSKNPLKAIGEFFNNIGGMLMGGLLNALGRPQKSQVASLLSPAPTGLWHLTIGNPFHPIMSLGNMVLTSTTITHTGPLGLDDFPTGIKVECDLTRGKPRDLRQIEMMYMNGNDRIYHSMGPKIFDMYTHAHEYKESDDSPSNKNIAGLTKFYTENSSVNKISDSQIKIYNSQTPGDLKKTLIKYFGTDDTFNIYVQAAEQEYGAWSKKTNSSGVSTGDVKGRSGTTGR